MSAQGSSSSMGNVLVKDETKSELPSSSRRFPFDCENPFQSPFYGSDVVLIVGEKKLNVDKKTLSLHSPVFQAMFDGDFSEKDAEEIKIKDTTYAAMVRFLRQMYPVKSFKIDDAILADILPLADFYQVDHIRIKCEDYIGLRIEHPESLSSDNKMSFLVMCDRFCLKHRDALLDIASKLHIREIKTGAYFESLQSNTKLNLLERRCLFAEKVCDTKEIQIYSAKSAFYKYRILTGKCRLCPAKLDAEPGYCLDCVTKILTEHLS